MAKGLGGIEMGLILSIPRGQRLRSIHQRQQVQHKLQLDMNYDDDYVNEGYEKARSLYVLTFKYTFQYDKDIVFFSHFMPYTFSDLEDFLWKMKKQSNFDKIARLDTLCYSLAGNPCYVLTITDKIQTYLQSSDESQLYSMSHTLRSHFRKRVQTIYENKKNKEKQNSSNHHPKKTTTYSNIDYQFKDMQVDSFISEYVSNHYEKRAIVLSSRVHPGESNASYMIQGVIQYLMSEQPDAKALRENFVFKIIPMLNPDGVIFGNYRCSGLGVDLNRRWINPSKFLHPTIFYTKSLVKQIHLDRKCAAYVDFHGHSRKKNVFMYGCCCSQNEPNHNKNNSLIRLLPFIMSQRCRIFSMKDSRFDNKKDKESTARLVFFKEFGILNSYTIESTFYGSEKLKKDFKPSGNIPDSFNPSLKQAIQVQSPSPKPSLQYPGRSDPHIVEADLLDVGMEFVKSFHQLISNKMLKKKMMDFVSQFNSFYMGLNDSNLLVSQTSKIPFNAAEDDDDFGQRFSPTKELLDQDAATPQEEGNDKDDKQQENNEEEKQLVQIGQLEDGQEEHQSEPSDQEESNTVIIEDSNVSQSIIHRPHEHISSQKQFSIEPSQSSQLKNRRISSGSLENQGRNSSSVKTINSRLIMRKKKKKKNTTTLPLSSKTIHTDNSRPGTNIRCIQDLENDVLIGYQGQDSLSRQSSKDSFNFINHSKSSKNDVSEVVGVWQHERSRTPIRDQTAQKPSTTEKKKTVGTTEPGFFKRQGSIAQPQDPFPSNIITNIPLNQTIKLPTLERSPPNKPGTLKHKISTLAHKNTPSSAAGKMSNSINDNPMIVQSSTGYQDQLQHSNSGKFSFNSSSQQFHGQSPQAVAGGGLGQLNQQYQPPVGSKVSTQAGKRARVLAAANERERLFLGSRTKQFFFSQTRTGSFQGTSASESQVLEPTPMQSVDQSSNISRVNAITLQSMSPEKSHPNQLSKNYGKMIHLDKVLHQQQQQQTNNNPQPLPQAHHHNHSPTSNSLNHQIKSQHDNQNGVSQIDEDFNDTYQMTYDRLKGDGSIDRTVFEGITTAAAAAALQSQNISVSQNAFSSINQKRSTVVLKNKMIPQVQAQLNQTGAFEKQRHSKQTPFAQRSQAHETLGISSVQQQNNLYLQGFANLRQKYISPGVNQQPKPMIAHYNSNPQFLVTSKQGTGVVGQLKSQTGLVIQTSSEQLPPVNYQAKGSYMSTPNAVSSKQAQILQQAQSPTVKLGGHKISSLTNPQIIPPEPYEIRSFHSQQIHPNIIAPTSLPPEPNNKGTFFHLGAHSGMSQTPQQNAQLGKKNFKEQSKTKQQSAAAVAGGPSHQAHVVGQLHSNPAPVNGGFRSKGSGMHSKIQNKRFVVSKK